MADFDSVIVCNLRYRFASVTTGPETSGNRFNRKTNFPSSDRVGFVACRVSISGTVSVRLVVFISVKKNCQLIRT